jgi:D-alanine-D-alanine ligase
LPELEHLRIAVVCGGASAEAQVSRNSAAAVSEALRESFQTVETLELDGKLHATLLRGSYDVAFPVLHGPPGEDGTFQGYLDILGLPYVGSGVRASANAMHKPTAKLIYAQRGLPIVPGLTVNKGARAEQIVAELGDDVVVKPCGQGSAIGVSFARDIGAIREALERAFSFGPQTLIEKRIAGKEITCAVFEEDSASAFPVVEVTTPVGAWYDYEHRYTAGLSNHVIPARIPQRAAQRVQEVALAAHASLECRDLSRSDFVVTDGGEVYLLETNTLPGMTSTSLYPDAARAAGIQFPELVARLVRNAWRRKG